MLIKDADISKFVWYYQVVLPNVKDKGTSRKMITKEGGMVMVADVSVKLNKVIKKVSIL